MDAHFEEVVMTRDRLRELIEPAIDLVRDKAIDHIDDICRRFIAASPFVMIATRGADGRLDVSPKGDPAGFVAVLDERTLAIPDRLGNNRLDTSRERAGSSGGRADLRHSGAQRHAAGQRQRTDRAGRCTCSVVWL